MSDEQCNKKFNVRPPYKRRRRKFQRRRWCNNENFCKYFNEKVRLADKLSIDEDELVDCIIDGIPDKPLRNQARMQRFISKEELYRAFEQIKLWPENESSLGQQTEETRDKTEEKQQPENEEADQRCESPKCYNCNKNELIAKNCGKAKRDRDSYDCDECEATDYQVQVCKKRKQVMLTEAAAISKEPEGQISNVTVPNECDNKYHKRAEVQLNADGIDCKFVADSQLDTEYPVSLVKAKFIPPVLIMQTNNEHYEGINESAIKILGVVNAKIYVEDNMSENVRLLVVPEHTMKYDALLGRDTLGKLGLMLIKQSREHEIENTASEILNIYVSKVADEEVDELNINPSLSCAIKSQVIEKFKTRYLQAERPAEPKLKAELKLNVKNEQPFHYSPSSKLTIGEKRKMLGILDDLVERKIIRFSTSEYASKIVLVQKEDGNMRLCIDFRRLNKIIVRENYPLPVIEQQIEVLAGKRYITSVNLKEGFYHVNVHEDSIKYTAFITPFGKFEYMKMPYGLINASARYQRYINEIFDSFIRAGLVLIHADDILIATKTVEEHLKTLERVFEILVENKIELRLNKCRFMYDKIEVFGYTVSDESIQPNNTGIAAIRNFPIPTCVREVKRFWNLTWHFSKFIADFLLIAGPLYDLMGNKEVDFEFGVKQREAFEELKNKLTSKPILSIYNSGDETELHCDASRQGYGAVLLQRKADRNFHPIFYFSKRTTRIESRYYDSRELEALAIIYALRKFRVYLQGIPFKIVTDCNSLVWALNKKNTCKRIARFVLELQEYDYETKHRPGKKMQHVDALSRSQ